MENKLTADKYHGNTIKHWENNAKEDFMTTPISVLKYITILEEALQSKHPTVTDEEIEKMVEEYEGVHMEYRVGYHDGLTDMRKKLTPNK